MPFPICAIYYPPFLTLASHLPERDATKIQEALKEKKPALNSGFNFAIAVRQSGIGCEVFRADIT